MTLSRASSPVYGGLWKWIAQQRTPRFISWKPATGESMPPDSKSAALPPVPIGMPPTAGISSTQT